MIYYSGQLFSFATLTADNRHQVQAALADAIGLIGSGATINTALLAHAPRLRAISTISVGIDQFDVDDLSQRGIALMHTPGVLTETTADTLFMLLMMTARRALELAEWVKAGAWQNSIDARHYGIDVHHKTIGIIGMGRIGYALAQRAHAGFNMSVCYHSNHAHPEAERVFSAQRCSLEALLARADFVCLTLPLTAKSQGLINAQRLAQMKPGAILINGSRGKIVDQQALIQALQSGQLRAAGLDVFDPEPLFADDPLLHLANVIALPHIGSATHETRYAMARCAVENLIAALAGNIRHNCANRHSLCQLAHSSRAE
ncbi:bifunctional glyoxylate/hydroxypyruvate reductase B [Edwardsiella ictaluri]|uniref:Glyoxylate/hydroxypyruvate reductase B n=2 Tax=Edwardsiella ictaluri TaxID=67780 RepID=C5BEE6_EDWI9|nr:bifunctional glyoxylate/hydroxypyruvate reductase B [Edwardsiella ictaluri]ACR69707.1 D-isomer specific 2-hydroxyacid dehydrogenase, catalytic domain protein, putative [Edwardsiella ictaluri 93-146]AVZ83314.1 bifunctional glyoxylate/hydroxypyruvate reductase B [Edwardsiella ictaluri]EKS7761807.1 bifunctional glyoxylate/hydroxypyruvate reductase B [Edwardsiella ictaluri]EKS7768617.1 bifunctional glyoxylate/hydroxypyruvate reductase B [Edwardsiella ictaluri]EKS7772065.1 bifunctional glyoxylat